MRILCAAPSDGALIAGPSCISPRAIQHAAVQRDPSLSNGSSFFKPIEDPRDGYVKIGLLPKGGRPFEFLQEPSEDRHLEIPSTTHSCFLEGTLSLVQGKLEGKPPLQGRPPRNDTNASTLLFSFSTRLPRSCGRRSEWASARRHRGTHLFEPGGCSGRAVEQVMG